MRLVTIRTPNGTQAGRLEGGRVVPLAAPDVAAVLEAGVDNVDEAGAAIATEAADLAPVIPRPSKILCLGLNYRSHIEEMGAELPKFPTLFAKFPAALIGARDPIQLPEASSMVDWEGELAFVIGRRVRNATADGAAAAIGGYTICNDVSMRDWQWRTTEWLQGKTWDRSTPLGPALVTPDEVGHAADLLLRCEVNGELMQEARTSDLLFKPADIVSYVSTIVTLEPGDVFSTGTPGGVGAGMQPARFLQPGEVVRTSIDGLGELVNECVKA